MKKIYRIEIWCSEDSCAEYWNNAPLSPFYEEKEDAERELKKYDDMSHDELYKAVHTGSWSFSIWNNRPKIIEYDLVTSDK